MSTSLCRLCRIRICGPQILNLVKDLRSQHLIRCRPKMQTIPVRIEDTLLAISLLYSFFLFPETTTLLTRRTKRGIFLDSHTADPGYLGMTAKYLCWKRMGFRHRSTGFDFPARVHRAYQPDRTGEI